MEFKEWVILESKKTVVSFDFDGVLHQSMVEGTTHPDQFVSADLEPRPDIHKKVRSEAKKHSLVVVTARDHGSEKIVWEFLDKHLSGLFQEVYTTHGGSKVGILEKIGAIRHYDDKDLTEDLKNSSVSFVHSPLFPNT